MGECVYFQIVRSECGYSYFGNCKYRKYIEYFVYLLNVYSARAGKFPSILIVSVIRNCLTFQHMPYKVSLPHPLTQRWLHSNVIDLSDRDTASWNVLILLVTLHRQGCCWGSYLRRNIMKTHFHFHNECSFWKCNVIVMKFLYMMQTNLTINIGIAYI